MKRIEYDTQIKALKPTDKRYKRTIGNGLYIAVGVSGAKTFRADFTLHGKRLTITYGRYPDIGLGKARDMHQEAQSKIRQGIDPRKKKQSLKPFSHYAEESFKLNATRHTTLEKKRLRMAKHIYPKLDRIPVDKITRLDVFNIVKPIADSGSIETARRLAGYIEKVFHYLFSAGIVSDNPVVGIRHSLPSKAQAKQHAHIIDIEAVRGVYRACNGANNTQIALAIKLQLLIFVRPRNLVELKWSNIDFDKRLITYSSDELKTGSDGRLFHVPLSEQAIEILNQAREHSVNEFVFSSERAMDGYLQINTLNKAIRDLVNPETGKPFGQGYLTLHGCKHTFSTIANESGLWSTDAIERQLDHIQGGVRGVYNKAIHLEERIEMMDWWSDLVCK